MTDLQTVTANETDQVINLQNGQNEAEAKAQAEAEAKEAEEAEEAEIWSNKYQNEALDKLRSEAEELSQKQQTLKFGTKGFMAAFEAIQAITNKIKVEIQGIKKQAQIAAQKAKEEAITNDLRTMVDLFKGLAIAEASGTPSEVLEPQANEANEAFEGILNKLLGNVPKAATAASGDTAASNGTQAHGNVRAEVEALFIEATAKGLNRTEAAKSIMKPPFGTGTYARGTTNTYIKDYLDGNGIQKP